jgi:hypothetical protein
LLDEAFLVGVHMQMRMDYLQYPHPHPQNADITFKYLHLHSQNADITFRYPHPHHIFTNCISVVLSVIRILGNEYFEPVLVF